jgi:hypothetical protein
MSKPYEGDSTDPNVPGLRGTGTTGIGVLGQSSSNAGLVATSSTGQGLSAFSDNDVAIFAKGGTFAGVFEGAFVVNKGPGRKDGKPDPVADPINGSIVINDGNLFVNKGDVILATAADCAEFFDIADGRAVEPGTVMVITDEGELEISSMPYDTRVAGIVSGAGGWRPGILLDGQRLEDDRLPIALMGKVYCKVDAGAAGVRVGDMLTTSATAGHAMKAADATRAFGAVIGKALRPLRGGRGLIPVLVALQ